MITFKESNTLCDGFIMTSDWETPSFAQIKKKKTNRISPYAESELWERHELLTIVKYESHKRTLLWDLNARNHEVTLLKVKHTLQTNKHLWIKKATGLGVTEFMLRYMAWLCFRNPDSQNTQMCIVTGPRIELAITLIDRMKQLFLAFQSAKNIERSSIFDTKETVNGVHIEAYPSQQELSCIPDVPHWHAILCYEMKGVIG